MSIHFRTLILAACLAALAACGSKPDRKQEEQKLMETSRAWSRAAQGDDVDSILAYWADDATVIQPGQEIARGRESQRRMIEGMKKMPGFRISWEPLEAHISDGGDMGYLIERNTVTMNGPDGRPVTQQYRAVTVWRKQPDGSWKNVVDISNPGSAAPAPPPTPPAEE
jgi:ketosteroid isomerase-like protein